MDGCFSRCVKSLLLCGICGITTDHRYLQPKQRQLIQLSILPDTLYFLEQEIIFALTTCSALVHLMA